MYVCTYVHGHRCICTYVAVAMVVFSVYMYVRVATAG